MLPTNKNKTKQNDLETKERIIKDFNESDPKVKLSVADIMRKYNITATSTLNTIVNPKNQNKIK